MEYYFHDSRNEAYIAGRLRWAHNLDTGLLVPDSERYLKFAFYPWLALGLVFLAGRESWLRVGLAGACTLSVSVLLLLVLKFFWDGSLLAYRGRTVSGKVTRVSFSEDSDGRHCEASYEFTTPDGNKTIHEIFWANPDRPPQVGSPIWILVHPSRPDIHTVL